MAIPKEPRQLMINIMYLVLTALLALNVSAEVFNAFKMVDKGLIKSNRSLDESNNALPTAIRDGAKKKESLLKYADLIDPGRQMSKDANDYLQHVIDTLINDKGYKEDPETGEITDELKAAKDYDITTRVLVNGPKGDGNGIGKKIKQVLEKYRADIIGLVEDDPETQVNEKEEFIKTVSVNIDDESWQKKKKKSWSHFNFDHMPLQSVLPILSKFQNDVKSTESAFLNYLAGKVGTTTDVVIDKYTVVSAPEKSYIIKGEKYRSEIFLSAAASADSKTGISISVNGRSLPLNQDGLGIYELTANSVGKQKYTATASITNPVTGETQTFKKEFNYEVGERSVAISPTKMNVFYIGVDNPVEVSAAGVASSQIKVSMSGAGGGNISKNSDGTYKVTANKPTKKGEFAKINVTAPGMNASKDFRVKRIPDPVPKLSKSRGGSMGSGEFKLQPGVFPVLENFDFDARCDIVGFRLVRVPKRQDPQVAVNRGGKFAPDARNLIKKATPSDKFFFEDIKCRCPGDPAPRDLGGMVFNIR
ncbi:MAG: hypothetical protein HKN67_05045 [Saprospiraceae bacterium]|nr:hypothetical protein [Bacteroidia bacterium]MBT8230871.1 hypothetical protein [Bacteroidia bacterium]NNF21286.1 hypothetical protein [Saprospiraceae bacterium]NNK89793.1 hypothetical protein [Saprospiraceae bacterium]